MTNDQALHHSIGLLSMTNQAELLSMLATRGVVDARRRQGPPTIGERALPSPSAGGHGGTPFTGGHRGTPSALAALLATREDIDATLDDQRPPYKPPDLPQLLRVWSQGTKEPQRGYALA